MIPKVIHYCWLSGEKKPLLIRKCMKTWRKILPDYEIKCWDANNFDFSTVPFVKQAYEAKKWAFVTDYIRFYAIYTEGGIYLDSDVELKKNMDSFLYNNLFIGTETIYSDELGDTFINPEPAIFGATARHPLLKQFMEYYEKRTFFLPSGDFDLTVCPQIIGKIMREKTSYQHLNEHQILEDGIHVYPTSFFCNIGYPNRKNVYAIHQFAGSWIGNENRGFLFKFCKKYTLMSFYKRIEKVISYLFK